MFWCLNAAFGVQAQTITAVRAPLLIAKEGQSVSLEVDYDPQERESNYCGLIINFGDGQEQQVRIESAQAPLRVQHFYKNAGVYAVSVEGKTIFRGFRTAISCQGGVHTTTIRIARDDAASSLQPHSLPQSSRQNVPSPLGPRTGPPGLQPRLTDPLTAYVVCVSAAYGELVGKYPNTLEAVTRSRLACQASRNSFERDLSARMGSSAAEVVQDVDLQIYRNFRAASR